MVDLVNRFNGQLRNPAPANTILALFADESLEFEARQIHAGKAGRNIKQKGAPSLSECGNVLVSVFRIVQCRVHRVHWLCLVKSVCVSA